MAAFDGAGGRRRKSCHSPINQGGSTVTQHPFRPIIYVLGFATTQSKIEDAVLRPHMVSNIGSTKLPAWCGLAT